MLCFGEGQRPHREEESAAGAGLPRPAWTLAPTPLGQPGVKKPGAGPPPPPPPAPRPRVSHLNTNTIKNPPGFPSRSSSGHSLRSVGCLPSRTRGLQQCAPPPLPPCYFTGAVDPWPTGYGGCGPTGGKTRPVFINRRYFQAWLGRSRRGWLRARGQPTDTGGPSGEEGRGRGVQPFRVAAGGAWDRCRPHRFPFCSFPRGGGARRNRAHSRGPRGSVSSREGGGPREGGCPCPRTLATPLSIPFPWG